jgi:hypothetical protein
MHDLTDQFIPAAQILGIRSTDVDVEYIAAFIKLARKAIHR